MFILPDGSDFLGGNPTGKYSSVNPFSNGVACVKRKDGTWVYINTFGIEFVDELFKKFYEDDSDKKRAVQLNDIFLKYIHNYFPDNSLKFYIFKNIIL